jgi:hypothetical protein
MNFEFCKKFFLIFLNKEQYKKIAGPRPHRTAPRCFLTIFCRAAKKARQFAADITDIFSILRIKVYPPDKFSG